MSLPGAPGQWRWEISLALLANRCLKWGSIDVLVMYHMRRTSGPGPPVSAAENLTHSAGYPGRGCPGRVGA